MSSCILVKLREKCPNFLFDSETPFEDTEVKIESVLYTYLMYVTMFEEHTFHVFKREVLRNISGSWGCKEQWRQLYKEIFFLFTSPTVIFLGGWVE